MRGMQELLFCWEGWDGTLCVPNAFSLFFFLQKKSITFKKNYIALLHLKRNNLNCLNWHRYFVVYRLYCLKTSDRLAGALLLCCRVALWPPLFFFVLLKMTVVVPLSVFLRFKAEFLFNSFRAVTLLRDKLSPYLWLKAYILKCVYALCVLCFTFFYFHCCKS